MKKILGIFIAAALLALPAYAANVTSGQHWVDSVKEDAAYGTPVIDGTADAAEWSLAPALTITLDDPVVNEYGVYQGAWESERNASDFSTEIRYMWDENCFYIYENRADDDVVLGGSSDTPWSGADGNLIFLQVADDDSTINPSGYSHHIFYTIGDNNGKAGGAVSVRINDESATTQETLQYPVFKYAAVVTDGGWSIEIAVPWSVFQKQVPEFTPAAGAVLGMSCVPIDNDADGGDFAQLCWFNQQGQVGCASYDYGGWAYLTLDAPVVIEEEPAAQDPTVEQTPTESVSAAQTSDFAAVAVLASIVSVAGAAFIIKKRG
ncbi:MAG: sugar-binding protein [Eubacteriales bacterium]